MKKWFAITLGILTAIGGFVDIGDIVANSEAGARFGMSLAWIVVVGVIGICVYAEMAGRVAAVSGRPVFDLVRERLGPRVGLVNLAGSYLVTVLTLGAELGGVALALQLATSVNYLLFVPVVGFVAWVVLWRTKFETIERVFGLVGLALVVFVVALFKLDVPWSELWHQASHPGPREEENWGTYAFQAVALFGAAMTPYEVFFFSSGGVEERWTAKDLTINKANVFIGFPLGGLLSLALMATAATVYHPLDMRLDTIGQSALPVVLALGKLGLAVVILGFFAATFGAAMETGLSAGYTIAQYFGWAWGKRLRPAQAARFHTVVLVSVLIGLAALATTVDPVQLTEYTLIFSAIVLPLTYLPILVVANDRDYLGDRVNGRLANALGLLYLAIIVVTAVAALPLMVMTGMGG
ncbi:NRAMP family divalent metal transporter [Dactylosporangium sp. CS-047395]|uniref:NRAMP family divalent metal transporter n=1 Tax=Dactylosporangium sp. CS-047395 TaxID=3239936 RepID=UPI003D8D20EA